MNVTIAGIQTVKRVIGQNELGSRLVVRRVLRIRALWENVANAVLETQAARWMDARVEALGVDHGSKATSSSEGASEARGVQHADRSSADWRRHSEQGWKAAKHSV